MASSRRNSVRPAITKKRAKLQEAMSFVNTNGDYIKGSDWLYYKYTSFKDGFEELKKLIEIFS